MISPDPEQAASFLEAALLGSEDMLDQATVDLSVELPLIEGFKLLRLLGEGGFGMVYEAEQFAPIRRRVALKVLRPGCTTRELLARFEQERQALALMNHPHIARIYDAGETEDGRPFIAMELVKGSTIDRHAGKLSVREKVMLMRDVCRAVGHAHRKGVIHRDLKPSNILITKSDDGPSEPRIIDFGIAKALDGPLSSKVMFTQILQVVGTPGYMSPERQHTSQIRHSADTRTDVFALGAILWELLTGKTPEQTPEGSTTRIQLPAAHQVPAELRWITEKATDADMERRYAHADGLADDLGNWLAGHPLTAAPRSTLYVLGKWARRHRATAAALAIIMVTLVTAFILILRSHRQMSAALVEAENSRREIQSAVSHADYLMGVTRERFRPVQAIAHWARALRHDPHNTAAAGMLLSALQHRAFPHPVAPAVSLPQGTFRHLALSADAKMATVILSQGNREVLVRAQRGEARVTEHPIPADGRMTLLAVSNHGYAAVAGGSGAVGLLQKDGAWLETESAMPNLIGLVWNSLGHLWLVGTEEVVRSDASGKPIQAPAKLPGRVQRWAASPTGDQIVIGVQGGIILHFRSGEAQPAVLNGPIQAPFSSIAISEKGEIAAAWRSNEIWLHVPDQAPQWLHVPSVLKLEFIPDSPALLARTPTGFVVQVAGAPAKSFEHPQRLLSALPLEGGRVFFQPHAGRGLIHDPLSERPQEIAGTSGHEQYALADQGRTMVLVDDDERALEWLSPASTPRDVLQHTIERSWLAIAPSSQSGVWHAVDSTGGVFETAASGIAVEKGTHRETQPRIAAIGPGGKRFVFDDNSGPGVLCGKDGETPQRRLWGKASSMALSPDGSIAALGYPAGHVTLWDMETGAERLTHAWRRGAISALAFVDERRIAVAASSAVHVWDWRAGQTLPHVLEFPGIITALAADPAGDRIALATSDGALHVLHTESGLRICGQLPASPSTTCLLWDAAKGSLWAFASDRSARQALMPPLLHESPPWLPGYAEQRIGMKVDDKGRVVRLRSPNVADLPATADTMLKEWLR